MTWAMMLDREPITAACMSANCIGESAMVASGNASSTGGLGK